MKKTLAKVACLALAVVTAVTGLVSCGKEEKTNYAANNTEIVIGASGPLTGGAAVYGQAVKNSAQMAVDEINNAGGVTINGNTYNLKFVMMDDKHDPSTISTNFTSLYEGGMQVSLGCVTSGPCLEFKTLSQEENVFFITPSASSDPVVEYDNAFQMCFADANQGVAAANYVNDNFAGQSVGILYRSDDAYSTGIVTNFEKTLNNSFAPVKASFSGDVVASFNSQIQLLKDCDLIFMPIYYGPAAQFMDEGKDTVKATAVYYGCDGLDGIDTAVQGFDISTVPQKVSFLSHFNSQATTGSAATFISKYTTAYGAGTLNQFGASAYDCVYAIKAALEKTTLTVTDSASAYCDALKGVFTSSTFSYQGVTGAEGTPITWNADGFVNKTAIAYVVKEATTEKK